MGLRDVLGQREQEEGSSSAAVPGHFQLGEGSSELGLARNTSLVSGRSLLSPRPCTSSSRVPGCCVSLPAWHLPLVLVREGHWQKR